MNSSRHYFRSLVSTVTFVGGHFLNRRVDRALLVIAIVALWYLLSYALIGTYKPDGSLSTFHLVLILAITPDIGALVLAIGSGMLTFADSDNSTRPALGIATIVSGTVLSLLGLLAIVNATYKLIVVTTIINRPSISLPLPQPADAFQTSVFFGGSVSRGELGVPPIGENIFSGEIALDGKPAVGAVLKVRLNKLFETEFKKADATGHFGILLSDDLWYANSISVYGWPDRPKDRNLLLFSGKEPLLEDHAYRTNNPENSEGLLLTTSKDSYDVTLSLELRDAISVQWPQNQGRDHAVDASISESKIAWSKADNSALYEVQLTEVIHEGSTTSFEPVGVYRLSDTSLALASLEHQQSNGPHEYAVTIYAFDLQKRLISMSGQLGGEYRFKLADQIQLVPQKKAPRFSQMEIDKMGMVLLQNAKRLDAAEQLIEDKLFDAAQSEINRVTGDAPAGRLATIKGYLLATQGQCEKATKLFSQAKKEGGPNVPSLKIRNACQAK